MIGRSGHVCNPQIVEGKGKIQLRRKERTVVRSKEGVTNEKQKVFKSVLCAELNCTLDPHSVVPLGTPDRLLLLLLLLLLSLLREW